MSKRVAKVEVMSFRAEALAHNPEHFAVKRVESEVAAGNWDYLNGQRDGGWNFSITTQERLHLRMLAAVMNPASSIHSEVEQWLASGFVPKAAYLLLIEKASKDNLAFKGASESVETIAALLQQR